MITEISNDGGMTKSIMESQQARIFYTWDNVLISEHTLYTMLNEKNKR